jgi:hypothetical protein
MGIATGGAMGAATGGVTGPITGGEIGAATSTCGLVDETTGALMAPDDGKATTVAGCISVVNAGVCCADTAVGFTTAGADGPAGEPSPLIFTLDFRAGGAGEGLFARSAASAGVDDADVPMFASGASLPAKLAKKSATF